MRFRNARGARVSSVLAALLLAACGQQVEAPRPSGGSMAAGSTSAVVNGAPLVSNVSFVPSTAMPGRGLEAVVVATDPDGDVVSLSFEWRIGGRRILSDGSSIQVPEGPGHSVIEVAVTASDGTKLSDPVTARIRIGNRPPRVTELGIETVDLPRGSRTEPHWRVIPTADDPDRDFVSFSYEWMINGRATDQRDESFPKSLVGRGDEVTVRVTATDGQAKSMPLLSPGIAIQNAAPVITSAPPAPDPSGSFRYLPTVRDPDGDERFSFRLVEGPAQMSIDSRTGELSWDPGALQPGHHPVELEVADEQGARSTQRFDITVRVGGAPAAPR